jgi:hypothetical protein
MKTTSGQNIVGYSTIFNHYHQELEKENKTENYYLTKQFFDFANIFIRSTCKRDKCEFEEDFSLKSFH